MEWGCPVRALSVTQPWASLLISGAKKIETRSWAAPRGLVGQRILIHASKSWSRAERELCSQSPFDEALFLAGLDSFEAVPRGCILGSVRLVECRRVEELIPHLSDNEAEFGNYGAGRWGWRMADPAPLEAPVPVNGALGVWEYTPLLRHDIVLRPEASK